MWVGERMFDRDREHMPSSEQEPHVALLALLRVKGVNWYFVAREAQRPEGLERLLAGKATEASAEGRESLELLGAAAASHDERCAEVAEMISAAEADGIALTTVLDENYPVNLRTIFNLPPFLFFRGELQEDDARAVAVVGTRQPTADGRGRATEMARLLTEHDVTVLSGLARGIDTAAHRACLDAGGRTIAVLGSGIRRIYPPENQELAAAIAKSGAVVSQFWPDTPPAKFTFPRRNVVMSGMGQGTVVIEASSTSGAKMQARLALEHGKRVWLLRNLVENHTWARTYVGRGARSVETVDDIVTELRSPAAIRERADVRLQLSLGV
jgi:DNA processing protein